MAEREAVIKEFEVVRDKYLELLGKLVELKVPGIIEPLAYRCMNGLLDLGQPMSVKVKK